MKEEWKETRTQFQDINLRFLIRFLPLMGSILIPCVFLFLSFNIGEKSQQPSEREGTPDQSSERETSEDMLRLVAKVKELKAILSEGARQQKESEKLQKRIIEELEEMKLQLQHVLSTKDSKYHKTYTTD